MPYGVISLCQPTTNTDGALLNGFFPEIETLVIAHGSFIQFYKILPNQRKLYTEFQIFGDVARVIPLRHPLDTQTNLLVILSDYRFSILRYTNGEITTVQSGNMKSSIGVEIDPPFRVAVSPKALFVQTCQTSIQYYRISAYSRLVASFNCPVCCKSIIDFQIMCVDDICARLVVLFEDFKGPTKIQVFESDEGMQIFVPKSNFSIMLESDAYMLTVLNETTVVAFSTNVARKIHFIITTSPTQNSSTVFTMHMMQSLCKLRDSLYVAIDAAGQIILITILDSGTIEAAAVGKINNPAALIRYNDTSAIAIGANGLTSMIHINNDEFPQKPHIEPLFESPGSITQIIPVGSSQVDCLCTGRYAAHLTREIQLEEVAQMPFPGCEGVWMIDERRFVTSFAGKTVALSIDEDKVSILDSEPLLEGKTIAFASTEQGYIQICEDSMSFCGKTIKFPKKVVHASINGKFTTVTFDDRVVLYENGEELLTQHVSNVDFSSIDSEGEKLCFVSWSKLSVGIFDRKGTLIKEINDISAVAAFFDSNVLVIVLERDDVIFLDQNMTEKRVQCAGLHTGVCPTPRGYCITGENPVMFVGGAMWTLACSGFNQASLFNNTAVIVSNGLLSIYLIGNTEPEVRSELVAEEIKSCVRLPTGEFVLYLNSGEFCVSKHPFIPSETRISEKSDDQKFVAMSVLEYKNHYLLAAAFSKKLKLYEIIHGILEPRSDFELQNVPYNIVTFCDSYLVAYSDMIQIFDIAPVSLSEIKLKPAATYQTLGASCCISAENDYIVVGDDLQSVSLIEYNRATERFEEKARNSLAMSIVKVLIKDGMIFGIDDFGSLYVFKYSNFHNTTVNELIIDSSYALCSPATSIAIADNGLVVIGTSEGQLIGVIELPADTEPLFTFLCNNVESLGQFSAEVHRIVMRNNFGLPCQTMFNLDLAILFLKLPEKERSNLAERFGQPLSAVDDICKKVLDIAYM